MELTVKGMTCGHCEAAVRQAVAEAAPAAAVEIDRARDRVVIVGQADRAAVIRAISDEGYAVADAG